MFETKLMSKEEWKTIILMEMANRGYGYGVDGLATMGHTMMSLIDSMAEAYCHHQRMMVEFMESLNKHNHVGNLGPASCPPQAAMWDPRTMYDPETKAHEVSITRTIKAPGAIDFIPIEIDLSDLKVSCDHEWVTWTGLFNTQTDCKKCGAVKNNLEDCNINID